MRKVEYDICVITAANEPQARGYREQLKWRKDRGVRFAHRRHRLTVLPENTEFFVYADPGGKRVGSGGATIYVLYKLLEYFCQASDKDKNESKGEKFPHQLFRGKRILILHSGGDSKRLPAYSAVGKIFIPLPTNSSTDGFVTLFDILIDNLMQLPSLNEGQVVIASGDVLLTFDASKIAFNDSGVTGLAYPGPVEIASNHGVYVVSASQERESKNLRLRKVIDFLQKPTYDELKECNGLDITNRAFIDIGIMNFGIDSIEAIMETSGISLEDGKVITKEDSLCESLINGEMQLDIYKEIAFALSGKTESLFPICSCAPSGTEEKEKSISSFTEALGKIPFFVNLLSSCEFFHIGTSKELLWNFHTINHTASIYDFQNFNSEARDESGLEKAFVYNTLLDTASIKVDGASLIEGCCLEGKIHLEGENILTGIHKGSGDIKLQKGICITCVPVYRGESWVSIAYGIEDDFKIPLEENTCSFLNTPFLEWMKNRGISPGALWKDDESHELWNARLFPVSTDCGKAIQISLNLQEEDAFQLERWRRTPRMSLKEILQAIDYERILSSYSKLGRKVNLERLTTILTTESNLSAEEILSWCEEKGDYITAVEKSVALIQQTQDMLFQARLYKLLSNILGKAHKKDVELKTMLASLSALERVRNEIGRGKAETDLRTIPKWVEDIAFELVREAIGEGLSRKHQLDYREQKIQIRSDEVVWVCSPIRLDFAGGWSDTPPYSLEHGGSVLNAAVKLNRQYPIQVIGKIHPEPFIKINSIDLGERAIITEISEMVAFKDPADWSALPKAAFVATGIISEDTEYTKLKLQDVLKELGGGIELTIFSAVPAGSGLGTSSILGAAIIACLSRMLGQEVSQVELFNRTLYMEQLMTTGGGWQDQIGGVVGGVKHIQTEPGLFQVPKISWTDLKPSSGMEMSDRFLLYYTGLRRMAKNILRNIVGRYLSRDARTLKAIAQLREKSFEMKEELDCRNIDAFGVKIGEVWELNKTLDPGTTNEEIDFILEKVSPFVYGAKLLGAGGGGFLFMVTKGSKQTQQIRKILSENPPNNRARFFDFEIDNEGLKVSVL